MNYVLVAIAGVIVGLLFVFMPREFHIQRDEFYLPKKICTLPSVELSARFATANAQTGFPYVNQTKFSEPCPGDEDAIKIRPAAADFALGFLAGSLPVYAISRIFPFRKARAK